jgi:hypothetical protein
MIDFIDDLKNIADKLAEPQNIPYFPGLYYGKTGIALFFSHYALYTQNDMYNEIAFGLISKINTQLYRNNSVNYAYGLCGVGAGIEYLVQNMYFEADTDEVLVDIDLSVSHHLTNYSALSSFNQIIGIGKYLVFRIKNTKRKAAIEKNIEKVVNLIEMQSMRTPFCRPDVLNLLYRFRDISEKALILLNEQIQLFNIQQVEKSPFEWFYFFYKTKEENQNCNIIDSVNRLILDEQLILNDMEYTVWSSLSNNNITGEQLTRLIEQSKTSQTYGITNGLAGIGLTLLTLMDKQCSTWVELL